MKLLRLILPLLLLAGLCSCGSKRNVPQSAEDYIAADLKEQIAKQSSKDDKKSPGKDVKKLIAEAESWKGTPYKYGGQTKKGADCSGFVMAVFDNALGIKLPRSSKAQAEYCKKIKKQELRAGDIVFFSGNKKGKVSHVGLYIGDGKFIHASSSRGVIVSDLSESYYVRNYNHAGRVLNP